MIFLQNTNISVRILLAKRLDCDILHVMRHEAISEIFTMYSSSVVFLIAEAKKRGIWKDSLGINQNNGALIPHENYLQFADKLTKLSKDPAFYFAAFSTFKAPEKYEEPGVIVYNMPDLLRAYNVGRLATNSFINSLHVDQLYGKNTMGISFYFLPNSVDLKKTMCENYFTNIFQMLLVFCGEKEHFIKLELPYKKPSYHANLEEFFQCPIEYFPQSPRGNIFLASSCLAAPNPFPESKLTFSYLRKKMHEQWRHTFFSGKIGMVYQDLLCNMRNGSLEIEETCKRIGIHPRQLQKELQKEGTSFRDILARVRLKKSFRLILQNKMNMEEIAIRSGFDSAGSMTRFYKQISEKTPTEIRSEYLLTMPVLDAHLEEQNPSLTG